MQVKKQRERPMLCSIISLGSERLPKASYRAQKKERPVVALQAVGRLTDIARFAAELEGRLMRRSTVSVSGHVELEAGAAKRQLEAYKVYVADFLRARAFDLIPDFLEGLNTLEGNRTRAAPVLLPIPALGETVKTKKRGKSLDLATVQRLATRPGGRLKRQPMAGGQNGRAWPGAGPYREVGPAGTGTNAG